MNLVSKYANLPFQYAFSGCDSTSSFFSIGKCKWFDHWMNCSDKDQLTLTFIELSNKPEGITSNQLDILETYVKKVYYPSKKHLNSIDIERMNHFLCLPSHDLRSIPFSRLGLIEHTKRSCFQAGWCWVECRENVHLPDVDKWGRKKNAQGKLIPTWQVTEEPILSVENVVFTCTCVTSRCANCKCARKQEECLEYCKCQRNCEGRKK